MSPDDRSQPESANERLEAYLDGMLMGDERREFEQVLTVDDELQGEVDLQHEIDGALGRLFGEAPKPIDILALAAQRGEAEEDAISVATTEVVAPATNSVTPSTAPATTTQSTNKEQRRKIFLAIAACLAWVVVGWRLYDQFTDDGYEQLALADIYQQSIVNGFKPKWVCEDDRQFAETFLQRQGVPLLLVDEAKPVMVGLSYLRGLTAGTTTMLARVDGEPILVFVDKLQNDTNPSKPSWSSGLSLFRRELDGLVLYEVTPLGESKVISSFYVPNLDDLPPRKETSAE